MYIHDNNAFGVPSSNNAVDNNPKYDLFKIRIYVLVHPLNLAVSTASEIKPIRNCSGVVEKAFTFVNTLKRIYILLREIEKSDFSSDTKQN